MLSCWLCFRFLKVNGGSSKGPVRGAALTVALSALEPLELKNGASQLVFLKMDGFMAVILAQPAILD